MPKSLTDIFQERVQQLMQRQVPAVQMAQKTAKSPQGQHIDKVIDIPVAHQRQTVHTVERNVDTGAGSRQGCRHAPLETNSKFPPFQKVQRRVKVPSVQCVEKMGDVPVAMQRQIPMDKRGSEGSEKGRCTEGAVHRLVVDVTTEQRRVLIMQTARMLEVPQISGSDCRGGQGHSTGTD